MQYLKKTDETTLDHIILQLPKNPEYLYDEYNDLYYDWQWNYYFASALGLAEKNDKLFLIYGLVDQF